MNMRILKCLIRYALMILIIITCITIFKFSSEQGEESSGTSAKFAKMIVQLKNKNLTEEELKIEIENIQFLIRKLAHFSIYMFLGVQLICCCLTFKGKCLAKFSISIILALIYACTDEIHQYFVPGRAALITDVFIDTLGAFAGIILVLLIAKLINIIKVKTKSKAQKVEKKKSVLFIASTGGHLNELMQVKSLFKKYDYHIVTEKTKIDNSLKEKYKDKISFLIYGTKKYPIRYIFKLLANSFISLYYFLKYKPEVVVTTGTHTAVPMCYIAKLFDTKIIFIETFANRTTGTVAGRLVYPIADVFVVQWEEMHKVYPKSVCWGWIY